MKSVLIIAYSWPPDNCVGSLRPAYLAKQLAEHGWQPIVVTVREDYYEYLDPRRAVNPGNALVMRTRCLPNPRSLYLEAKKTLFAVLGWQRRFDEIMLRGRECQEQQGSESSLGGVKRHLLSLLYTPDECQGWIPPGVIASLKAIRRHRIECMISTGPPFSAHLVGLTVKILARVPWIADFRDPWSFNEQRPPYLKSSLSDSIERRLEARVMERANSVVTVTPAMTEQYRRLYPRVSDKCMTITNGYDGDEFRALEHIVPSGKFTVTYLGRFDYSRSPQHLLHAIGALKKEGVFKDSLVVKFIGRCRWAAGASVEDMIRENGLEEIVHFTDMLPRVEALREMLSAHVLVLLANEQKHQVPGKAYEYLAARRRILCMTEEDGATADLIRHYNLGAVVSPNDVDGVKRVLARWYTECQEPPAASADPQASIAYEWATLGSQYASLLDRFASPARAAVGSRRRIAVQ
jgi:glycosyltransferase involved in cell wall biosynthesis